MSNEQTQLNDAVSKILSVFAGQAAAAEARDKAAAERLNSLIAQAETRFTQSAQALTNDLKGQVQQLQTKQNEAKTGMNALTTSMDALTVAHNNLAENIAKAFDSAAKDSRAAKKQ